MHYHYYPQMPGDGKSAYCEEHVAQTDLQSGMVYVCDCESNTCVVCEEDTPDDPICAFCDTSVLPTDPSVRHVGYWVAHMECALRYGRERYGKPMENPPT